MRVLRARLGLVNSRGLGIVFLAVFARDKGLCRLLRVCRNTERVGTHIGNQTLRAAEFRSEVHTFVQFLRHFHDLLRLEAQFFGSLLLHGRGCERRRGRFMPRRALDRRNGILFSVDRIHHDHGFRLGIQPDLPGSVPPEMNGDRLSRRVQNRVDRPVFDRNERADLFLALHDDAGCNRLHPSRAQTALDILPEQRAEFVTDDAVENPTGLLRVDQIHIDGSRRFDCRFDRRFGHLVEADALGLLHGNAERCRQMPRDGFSFAVRVGCEKDFVCRFRFLADFLDEVAFAADADIMRFKAVFDIHAERAFR